MTELIERLMSRVQYDTNGGCWLWCGSLSAQGYGRIEVGRGTTAAHRAMYECLVGPITEGLVCDHLCRVTACVNPAHIEPVTNAENLARGIPSPSAVNASKTICIHGHEFTAENTALKTTGYRRCAECHRAACREHYRQAKLRKHGGVLPPAGQYIGKAGVNQMFSPDEDAIIQRLATAGLGPAVIAPMMPVTNGIARSLRSVENRLRRLRRQANAG